MDLNDKAFIRRNLVEILKRILKLSAEKTVLYISDNEWLVILSAFSFIYDDKRLIKSLYAEKKLCRDGENDAANRKRTRAFLQKIMSLIAATAAEPPREGSQMETKIDGIIRSLGLGRKEKTLLITAIISYMFDLSDISLGVNNFMASVRYLNIVTRLPVPFLLKALSPDSTLHASKILRKTGGYHPFNNIAIDSGIAAAITSSAVKGTEIFSHFFREVPRGMGMRNFRHLDKDSVIVRDILTNAVRQRTRGVNILLYGRPGTGKTEYARSILSSLKIRALSIEQFREKETDEDGKDRKAPAPEEMRLGYFSLCQRIHREAASSAIIFDEADAVLNTMSMFNENSTDKSPVIEALDRGNIPVIWIVNGIRHMHEAVRRRFSYSMRFDTMPHDVNERICRQGIEREGIPEEAYTETIQSFIKENRMTVGQTTLALKRVGEMKGLSAAELSSRLERVLVSMSSLEKGRTVSTADRISGHYDLSFLSIDTKPESIIDAVERFTDLKKKKLALPVKNLNMLFHGAPGVGKSEFARYIAESAGKPLIIKRASDIFDMYVGGSEKNIRAAFDETEQQNGILLFDEADSFFQRRENAQRSWEISQVNELLNAMERFTGILICTTNFIDNFDRASLRRFAFKVRFDYLSGAQCIDAAQKIFGDILPDHELCALVKTVAFAEMLAIGDFKAVYQQIVFDPDPTAEKIAALLRHEADSRTGSAKPGIGFRVPRE